jgi:hypothetical protein
MLTNLPTGSEASLRCRGHQRLPYHQWQRAVPHSFGAPDPVAPNGPDLLWLR